LQTAFGLLFESDRNFEELNPARPGQSRPAVALRFGATPGQLTGSTQRLGLCEASESEFLLSIPQVARYHVTRAAITVTPASEASDAKVRLFLFGSAMGALLHLNDVLILHGAAIRRTDGGCAVFCGRSTSGKSTTAAALVQRGYAPMADDIAAVHFDAAGQAWLHPGLARGKLWGDALEQLGMERGARAPIHEGLDKFQVAQELWHVPERVAEIHEIRAQEGGGVGLAEITGLDKVGMLARQTYRARFVALLGRRREHMRQLGQLAPQVRTYALSRPRGRQTVAEIADMIEKAWR
jgi:hypothetical protein